VGSTRPNDVSPQTRPIEDGESKMDSSGRISIVEESRIGLILMLLREGSTRHAVMVYQEEADVSFFAAQRSVYELARQHKIDVRKRSLLPLALIALAGLLGLMLSH
jgi:hypothetical protein